jgi:hypothetical protein
LDSTLLVFKCGYERRRFFIALPILPKLFKAIKDESLISLAVELIGILISYQSLGFHGSL